MDSSTTVVFADLSGSTAVYETLGNARAAETITGLTHWIGRVCEAHGGRVVKTLGDGVLAVFPDSPPAVTAVVELQRSHTQRLAEWPDQARLRLRIGIAAGEVIEVGGDCFGDAVNVASRLSDLSGPEEIWATRTVVAQLGGAGGELQIRSLGQIPLRGRSQPSEIFQIDWDADAQSRHLTRPALLSQDLARRRQPAGGGIRLAWLDKQTRFRVADLPVHLGRSDETEFAVQDPRVSRLHARIEWRNGSMVLTDVSSYGTWVRFAGGAAELVLRREECILVGSGELALGASFEDFTVPTVQFEVLSTGQ
ncbi:adenylate/guanylate cyclase domain-containing protein [Ramlibacter sp.]|uniref:adenylate/guanylate cyclase domain-containing protein n=1 Tax=Ramlibacter sp. TaxID=1917967 RepID=UPI002C0DB339|nr:adenylate/guanylate cyclase domain-containing protein [Ramlibacter sp.]HWI83168.1 adenylate/guanylate cyclase domain-containing protein [Ramlibacter sp.]